MTKIEIDTERCKGCGLCTLVCAHELLSIGDEINGRGYFFAKWNSDGKCTGCSLCAEICPDIAIVVWK
jgi:2-oxoglutarate ferredoxin oxidoreductase subunit delta